MKNVSKYLVATIPFLLFSCAQTELTGDAYDRAEVGAAQTVNRGRITDIRYVSIEGNTDGGTLAGGVAGGFLGREIGNGAGSTAGAIGGSLLGAAVGSRVQKAASGRQGVQIEVRLDTGKTVSVVQQVNPRERFTVGERVKVLSGGGRTRVTH